MSELSKQALKVENNMEFPNNNSGLITPSKLRTFNEDMIDSTVNQAVYTSDSASWNAQIAAISASAGADTSALNQFTASQDIKNTTLASVTASLQQQLTNIGSQSGSWITESETGSFARYDVSNPWSANQNFTNITAVSASFTYVKTTYETSSVIYSSGSNQFGDAANDIQTLYGSVKVMNELTASGLNYPTADNGVESFIQTDGAGNLSLQYVKTIYQNIRNRESVTIQKGTPLFVSGSTGDNADVFIADAGNPLRMPATLIAGDNTLAAGATGKGIIFGHIDGVNTTGYPAGTEVYVGVGGGWTSTRPTGSATPVQPLGVVTREGNNGMGIVLTQVPFDLPNIQTGYAWVGNGSNQPVAVATSSFGTPINTGSFATTGSNTFIGNEQVVGVVQASDANVGPQWVAPTVFQGVGSSAVAYDQFVNAGNYDALHIESNLGAGTKFQDYNGSGLNTWMQIPANVGSNPSPIFVRGLEITGSANIAGQLIISSSAVNDLIVSGTMALIGGTLRVTSSTSVASIAPTLVSISSGSNSNVIMNRTIGFYSTSGSSQIGLTPGSTVLGLGPSIFASSGSSLTNYSAIQFQDGGNYTDGRVTFPTPVVLNSALTASLTEGYVWAGGVGNVSKLVATSSFGTTINTGSFATTGSNSFFGTNSFSGAVSFTGSAPTIVSQSFSGSLITNLTDIYTDIAPVKQIVTLTSASYASLVSGGTVDENTLYIVSGSTTGGTTINTGSFATTGSNTFIGNQIITGSVRAFGSGYDIVAGTYDTNYYGVALNLTPDLKIGDVQVGGQDVAAVEMYAAGGNYDTLRISVNSGSQGILFQDFPAGVSYTTWMNVETSADLSNLGDVTLHRNTNISGNLDIQSTLTASLQQGYVWVGNVNGRTTTVATSSFGGGGGFPYTGNAVITGSLGISGSMFGGVIALSVATATASVDFSAANMFTLTLPSASTYINPTNIRAGQTVNIQITQPTPGTGSVTFPSNVKFAGGNDYQATATGSAIDMLTLVSYDGTNVLATSIKNFL